MFQAIHRSHVHIKSLRWQPFGHLYSTCTTVYIYDGLTRPNPSQCQVFLPNARSQCPAHQPIPHPPIHTDVYKHRLQRLGVLSAYLRSRNRIAMLCTPYFPPTRVKTTKKKNSDAMLSPGHAERCTKFACRSCAVALDEQTLTCRQVCSVL